MTKGKFIRPKPVHRRQTKQKWLVGSQVRLTKVMEPALRDVPLRRLTATGIISRVYIRFARTPNMRRVCYEITLNSEILGSELWNVQPGEDSFKVEIL